MSGSSLERVEEIFSAALEMGPEEREAHLAGACGGDGELRHEVEELLAAHDAAEGFFDDLTEDIARGSSLEIESAARPRLRIGPWEVTEVLGRGGMGVVYAARRADGAFEQEVALKLLHLDLETPEMRARFLAERQLLARLDHPHVARLLDGGFTDDGRPYFVMERVDGEPITAYCRREELPIEEILRVFLDVVDAVGYLHRNLVVHRDLKPGNVLVDGEGRLRLLDFGIAKLLDDDRAGGGRTATGEQLLSLDYAAPEQLANEPVTTATDVYALGVVLYELLTGRLPFRRTARDLLLKEAEPPTAPSVVARTAAGGPGSSGEPMSAVPAEEESGRILPWRRIVGDLDTVCLTALAPEPGRRYPTAEQLGQDVERHLEGLPLRARAPSVGYRVGKFVRRHRGAVAAGIAVLGLLAAGFVRERALRREAERAREAAQQETAKVRAISEFTENLLASADPERARGREITVSEVVEQAKERIEGDPALRDQPAVEARLRFTLGRTSYALGRYRDAEDQLRRAVELARVGDTPELERLEMEQALGLALRRNGSPDAEEVLKRVLDRRTEVLGAEDPATLEARNHYASVLWGQARYEEVEALDRETLAIRQRVLGSEHPDTLGSVNSLAATLFNQGRFAEAEPLFRRAAEGWLERAGNDHPETLKALSNLGGALAELGRYRESIEIKQRVLASRERILGPEHPATGFSHHNLGTSYVILADFEKAEEHLRRAIEIRSRLESPSGVLFSQSFLADSFLLQGRLDEAEALYRDTLDGQVELYGLEHASPLRTSIKLAEVGLLRGHPAEAEERAREVIALQEETIGDFHGDLLGSRTILARIRLARGDPDEALALADRVLADGREALGEGHPLVLEALEVRLRALDELGLADEAEAEVDFLVAARERTLGPDHPRTVAARELRDRLTG